MLGNLWPSMSYELSSSENHEAEMLYFYSKLSDSARGTNSENLGNAFVFVKINCKCFENNFCPSLSAKSQENVNLPKRLTTGETFFADFTIIVLTYQIYTLERSNQTLKSGGGGHLNVT